MNNLNDDMTVLDRFKDTADTLTPNERRLVQTVIESPTSAALGTASALAKSVGVHEATASRLARKLGYASYAEFRDALRDAFIATQEPATRFEKTISETSSDTILGNLIQQEANALQKIEDFISPAQITTVAARLLSANRLYIYGHGNAETLAVMMLKRFRRFGGDVHKLDPDPRGLAEQALGFRKGDIVLTFVFRRPPRAYRPLLELAREAGAETVVIAGSIGATLVPQPDHLMAAPRAGDPDGFQTLTVPMTVCNALVIAAGLTARNKTLKTLDRLGQLIGRFE